MKNLVLGALLAVTVAMPTAIDAQELEKQRLFEKRDGAKVATVDLFDGATCSLVYVNEAQEQSMTFAIGRTMITSQLAIYSATDIGAHGDDMMLQRVTAGDMETSETAFAKARVGGSYFKYSASLGWLEIGLDDLRKTGGFRLSMPPGDGEGIIVRFGGPLRDEAVVAFEECVAGLEEPWNLESDR